MVAPSGSLGRVSGMRATSAPGSPARALARSTIDRLFERKFGTTIRAASARGAVLKGERGGQTEAAALGRMEVDVLHSNGRLARRRLRVVRGVVVGDVIDLGVQDV